ncbi:hypothetical protein PM082_012420 [Marasmius tenuissimus]|nr:hypothetical protein PM082_012420 [Marasmius tenuissimus]
MGVDWLALITLALYAAYTQLRGFNLLLERQYAKAWVANLGAFFCCGLFSLGAVFNPVGMPQDTDPLQSYRKRDHILCAGQRWWPLCGLQWAYRVLQASKHRAGPFMDECLVLYMDREGIERAQTPAPEHYQIHAVEIQPRSSSTKLYCPAPTSNLSHKCSYRVPPAPPSPTKTIEYSLRNPVLRKAAPLSSVPSQGDATGRPYRQIN